MSLSRNRPWRLTDSAFRADFSTEHAGRIDHAHGRAALPYVGNASERRRYGAWTQLGMFSNCGRLSGFAHLRRRLVNISSTGSMPSGLSRLPSVTKIIAGKLSRLLVNTLAPHLGQKFRSRRLPDWAM